MKWIVLTLLLGMAAYLFFFRIGITIKRGPKPYRMKWLPVLYGYPGQTAIDAAKSGRIHLAGCMKPPLWPLRRVLVINMGVREAEVKADDRARKVVIDYLSQEGWSPEDYRLDEKGATPEGLLEIYVVHRDNEKEPRSRGGKSMAVFLDPKSNKIAKVLHFQ